MGDFVVPVDAVEVPVGTNEELAGPAPVMVELR
jgi:hypothetical protein